MGVSLLAPVRAVYLCVQCICVCVCVCVCVRVCVCACVCACVISNESTSKLQVSDHCKLDALLHKTHSKVQGLTYVDP